MGRKGRKGRKALWGRKSSKLSCLAPKEEGLVKELWEGGTPWFLLSSVLFLLFLISFALDLPSLY
jgi:hypothetical protein